MEETMAERSASLKAETMAAWMAGSKAETKEKNSVVSWD
jgi:hypothetical protein